MQSCELLLGTRISVKLAISAPRSPSFPEASSRSERSLTAAVNARRFCGLMFSKHFLTCWEKSIGLLDSKPEIMVATRSGVSKLPMRSCHALSRNFSKAAKRTSTETSAAAFNREGSSIRVLYSSLTRSSSAAARLRRILPTMLPLLDRKATM